MARGDAKFLCVSRVRARPRVLQIGGELDVIETLNEASASRAAPGKPAFSRQRQNELFLDDLGARGCLDELVTLDASLGGAQVGSPWGLRMHLWLNRDRSVGPAAAVAAAGPVRRDLAALGRCYKRVAPAGTPDTPQSPSVLRIPPALRGTFTVEHHGGLHRGEVHSYNAFGGYLWRMRGTKRPSGTVGTMAPTYIGCSAPGRGEHTGWWLCSFRSNRTNLKTGEELCYDAPPPGDLRPPWEAAETVETLAAGHFEDTRTVAPVYAGFLVRRVGAELQVMTSVDFFNLEEWSRSFCPISALLIDREVTGPWSRDGFDALLKVAMSRHQTGLGRWSVLEEGDFTMPRYCEGEGGRAAGWERRLA